LPIWSDSRTNSKVVMPIALKEWHLGPVMAKTYRR
jgi:hypothetical protein